MSKVALYNNNNIYKRVLVAEFESFEAAKEYAEQNYKISYGEDDEAYEDCWDAITMSGTLLCIQPVNFKF